MNVLSMTATAMSHGLIFCGLREASSGIQDLESFGSEIFAYRDNVTPKSDARPPQFNRCAGRSTVAATSQVWQLLIADRARGVHSRSASCGHVAGSQTHHNQKKGGCEHREPVIGLKSEQQRTRAARCC